MIVYGRNAVREAVRGPRRVRRVWATKRAARELWPEGGPSGPSAADAAGPPGPVASDAGPSGAGPSGAGPSGAGPPPLDLVGADEIARRCGAEAHQGVCAEVSDFVYADAAALLARPEPLLVALDEVTDPQNLGAVCRSAECAGATGVVIPERRAAEVTAAVCKASAGAVEHLPVARVRNLADFLAAAKAAGCWCYGAAAGAPTPYRAPDYRGGVVLVLGAEGRGLRPRVAAACDDLVALPLRGRIESLNVSATAAVLLYEILHQRLDATT